jgi:hypothetical protein
MLLLQNARVSLWQWSSNIQQFWNIAASVRCFNLLWNISVLVEGGRVGKLRSWLDASYGDTLYNAGLNFGIGYGSRGTILYGFGG